MAPKKSTPLQILTSKKFLEDQGKVKKAEQRWFDMLEEELERMEMDEAIKKYQSTRRHESSHHDDIENQEDEFEKPKNVALGERPSSAKKQYGERLEVVLEQ